MKVSVCTRAAVVPAIVCFLSSAAHAQSAYPCWSPNEIESAHIKDFQTWMMVGVLKCNDAYPNIAGNYNYFIVENRNALTRHQDVLKARFMRLHGQVEGQHAYDKFTTVLANRHSRDADISASNFCATVNRAVQAAVATAADAGNPGGLEALAAIRPERASYASADCAAPVADRAPALPPPAASVAGPAVLSSPAAEPDPALQTVSATEATTSLTPEPSQQAAQANGAAAAPAASQSVAAALQAAATALQSAAAALQLAQAQGTDRAQPNPP